MARMPDPTPLALDKSSCARCVSVHCCNVAPLDSLERVRDDVKSLVLRGINHLFRRLRARGTAEQVYPAAARLAIFFYPAPWSGSQLNLFIIRGRTTDFCFELVNLVPLRLRLLLLLAIVQSTPATMTGHVHADYGTIHGGPGPDPAPTPTEPILHIREDQPLLRAPTASPTGEWLPPRGFFWIQLAIMSNVFLYGFDGTITASTYAVISSEFDAANTASWLTTSYLITATAFQPLYGRFSDIFGRRICFFVSSVTFGLGCLGCGLSEHIVMLNCMRALTGFGGGGLMTMGEPQRRLDKLSRKHHY